MFYHIDDEWILKRVMGQSSSFSQWIRELMDNVEKSLEAKDPEAAEAFRKKKNLLQLREADEKLRKLDERLTNTMEKLSGLGSIGDFISTMAANIIEKNLQKSLGSADINIDFITGKRRSLSSALYDVTKERGIDSEGILYLIQSLPDLESFLYSTSVKKYYRDHTEHQLRVAVLGDFLLEQEFEQGTLVGITAEILDMDESFLKEKIWWIVGLIHDIGYPLSKMTTAVNWSLVNQILKCYPHLDLEVVPMEVTLVQSGPQEEYLVFLEEGMSPKARELVRIGVGYNRKGVPIPEPQAFVGGKNGHPEFAFKSDISLDHGVVGALILLRSLGTPEDIRENRDDLEGYLVAARAIALHNFKDKLEDFLFDSHPLSFLLVLIDEMQEWGRPIPLQIRDTYFTTELKKVALLDEIILAIDEFQWVMQYKNADAKKLIKFDFDQLCNGKKAAFFRLERGDQFQETTILLQDYRDKGGEGAEDISKLSEVMKMAGTREAKPVKKRRSFHTRRADEEEITPERGGQMLRGEFQIRI